MSLADIRFEKGRIILNPTDIDLASGGGTYLGTTFNTAFIPHTRYGNINAEEWGNSLAASAKVGDDPVLIGILIEWNDTALATLYPGTTTVSGTSRLHFGPNTAPAAPGQKLTPLGVLFIPDDESTGRYVYLPAAIPKLGDMGAMNLRLDAEVAISFAFEGTPSVNTLRSAYHGTKDAIRDRIAAGE